MSAGLDQAFALAAGELGLASAAWLFAREVDQAEGHGGIQALRDALGRNWPVLDAVCSAWLSGTCQPQLALKPLLDKVHGLKRLLVVGLEAHWLDALVAGIPAGVKLGLLRHSDLEPNWQRVHANLNSRVELVELDDFQGWAGSRSGLLSFVYAGQDGIFALSSWLRVFGPDVRTQFRELLGWDVLQLPISVYPRWLVAVPAEQFTALVGTT